MKPDSTSAIFLFQDAEDTSASTGLDALRRRERGALARFYNEHVEHVDRLVFRLLGPDQEHQDVVQEVFIHAIQGIEKFKGNQEQLRPWLIRIAVNRVRRKIRHRSARSWLRLSPSGELKERVGGSSPEMTHALDRAFMLIKKLGVQERLVFSMRCIEKMTFPQIAQAMEISESTAKRAFSKAQARFDSWAAQDVVLAQWLADKERGL